MSVLTSLQVLLPLLRYLQAAVLGWASERKRLGRAQFQDLLVWTRVALVAGQAVLVVLAVGREAVAP